MEHDPPSDDLDLHDPLVGVTLAERYRIEELLGEGAAGRVYRAIHLAMGREVAIKVLRGDVTSESRQEFAGRFFREASLLGKLSHPNVVVVHDYGTAELGEQFVVMELLRGQSLADVVRDGPIDDQRAAWIAESLARGLAHAHAHGLVHRDVKPSNVFLVPDRARERAVLLDFGLVKADGPDIEATRSGTYMGTPAYTAPEQARGDEQIDGRADVYALGVLLYRMLAGDLPYQGANAMGTVLQHLTYPYPPIADRTGVQVHPGLEAIVQRAMAKSPDRRFQSADEMADAIEGWRMGRTPIPVARARAAMVPILGGLGAVLALAVAVLGAALAVVAFVVMSRPAVVPAPPPEPAAASTVEPAAAPTAEPAAASTAEPAAAEPVPVAEPLPPPVEPPAAQPAPEPTPSAVPKPPAAPKPKPKPKPKPEPVEVDGVHFSGEHAARALQWINAASEQDLRDAGVYARGVNVILENRPFVSMQAFGDTPYIGEATVRAVATATSPP